MRRRDFLKAAGLVGTSSLLKPDLIFGSSRQSTAFFHLHPFVEAHPEAVFIKMTSVSDRSAAAEKNGQHERQVRALMLTNWSSTAASASSSPSRRAPPNSRSYQPEPQTGCTYEEGEMGK